MSRYEDRNPTKITASLQLPLGTIGFITWLVFLIIKLTSNPAWLTWFLIIKLTSNPAWLTWFWVWFPFWLPWALLGVELVIILIVVIILAVIDR